MVWNGRSGVCGCHLESVASLGVWVYWSLFYSLVLPKESPVNALLVQTLIRPQVCQPQM